MVFTFFVSFTCPKVKTTHVFLKTNCTRKLCGITPSSFRYLASLNITPTTDMKLKALWGDCQNLESVETVEDAHIGNCFERICMKYFWLSSVWWLNTTGTSKARSMRECGEIDFFQQKAIDLVCESLYIQWWIFCPNWIVARMSIPTIRNKQSFKSAIRSHLSLSNMKKEDKQNILV